MSIAIRSSIGLTSSRNSKKDLKKNIENNNNHRITSSVILDLAPLEEYVSDKYSTSYEGFFSLLTQTEETPDTEDLWVVRLNHLRFIPDNYSDEWVESESELYDPSVYHQEMAEIERLRKEEEEAVRRKEEERLRLEEEERQKVVAEKLRQFKQKREEFIRAEQIRRRKRTDSFKKRQREVDDRVEAWIQRKKAGIKESPREIQSLDGDDLMENMSILQLMEQRKRTQPTAGPKSRDKNTVTVRDDNTDKVIEDQVRQQKMAKESEVDNEEENRLLREEEDRIRKEHEQEVRARREQEQTKKRSDRHSIFQIIETEQERKQRLQNEIAELHSRIASGDVPYTVELLRANHPQLKKLDLQSREVPLEDFQLIGEALATNKVVQELDLSLNTTFNDDYLPTLCHIVKHNRAIKRLYLEETEIMNHESLLVTLEEYNAIILDLTLSPFATPEERDQLDELLARNESELR